LKPDLATLSKKVFDLDEPDKRILKYLALYGPMNLSELAKHTTKYAYSLDRWSLRKHLEGSSRFIGLIPYEYVSLTRLNKKETKYELTTKGVLASLSNVPLEKNVSFKNFVNDLKKYCNYELEFIIKDFINVFIKLILHWHHITGLDITKLKSSEFYFMNFIDSIRKLHTISITQEQKESEKDFFETMRKCIVFTTIIDLFSTGAFFRTHTELSLADWGRMKSLHMKNDASNEYLFAMDLWQWPFGLGKLSHTKFSYHPDVRIYEFNSEDLVNEVNKKLNQIGFKMKWKDLWSAPLKYP